MSRHDRDDWLNPANPLSPVSPLNPYNPLNPNYKENMEGLASAVDEMPPLLSIMLSFVLVVAFIAANIFLASLTFWTAEGVQLPNLQGESPLLIVVLIVLYLLGVAIVTIQFTILGSIPVILCYCVICLLMTVFDWLVTFVKRAIARIKTP